MISKVLMATAAVVVLTALACGGPSVSVNFDYDQGYDFSNMKNFAYLPIKSIGTVSELRVRRFVDAINNELQTQGYILTTENPDFLVAMHSSTQEKTDVSSYGYSYGPRWGGYRDVDVSHYTEGTVFVDIVDPDSRNLIWRGTAQSTVDPSAGADEQNKVFAQIATRLFANFPPKP